MVLYITEELIWYITFYLSKKYETYFKKGEKNNTVSMLKSPKNISTTLFNFEKKYPQNKN
tara:strand:+ start:258 stop:437 length:180 start_codon:yes stop_codon:yes gene_type:complete